MKNSLEHLPRYDVSEVSHITGDNSINNTTATTTTGNKCIALKVFNCIVLWF